MRSCGDATMSQPQARTQRVEADQKRMDATAHVTNGFGPTPTARNELDSSTA